VSENESDHRDGNFMAIRWSHVALGAVIVAIGSLGALAVVASVKQADTLSTVALALAVLAFVIQIIFFVAQAATNASDHREVQGINTDTARLLVELRTHAVDTNQLVSKQFDKLLDRFVLEAKSEGDLTSPEGDESRREVLAQLSVTAENLRRGAATSGVLAESSRNEEEHDPRSALVQTWLHVANVGPRIATQRRLSADEKLQNLPPGAVDMLGRFAADLVMSIESGIPDGHAVDEDNADAKILRRVGVLRPATDDRLVSFLDDDDRRRVLLRLTAKGRALSSLITARAVPAETLSALRWLEGARAGWEEIRDR
jgi:hypothetical protein